MRAQQPLTPAGRVVRTVTLWMLLAAGLALMVGHWLVIADLRSPWHWAALALGLSVAVCAVWLGHRGAP